LYSYGGFRPALVAPCCSVSLIRVLHEPQTLTPAPTGSFTAYTARFVSPSYAFALGWNYWLNDAVSLAGDLTAAQLVLRFWLTPGSWWHGHTWILSVTFWAFLVGVNAVHVKAYGEMGMCTLAMASMSS
jgi:amino acid permease